MKAIPRWQAASGLAVVLGLLFALLIWLLVPSLIGPHQSQTTGPAVTATVAKTASCTDANPHDQVTVGTQTLTADACGNPVGTQLQVIINGSQAQLQVATSDGSNAYLGVGFLALAISSIAGGLGAYLLAVGARPGRAPLTKDRLTKDQIKQRLSK